MIAAPFSSLKRRNNMKCCIFLLFCFLLNIYIATAASPHCKIFSLFSLVVLLTLAFFKRWLCLRWFLSVDGRKQTRCDSFRGPFTVYKCDVSFWVSCCWCCFYFFPNTMLSSRCDTDNQDLNKGVGGPFVCFVVTKLSFSIFFPYRYTFSFQ